MRRFQQIMWDAKFQAVVKYHKTLSAYLKIKKEEYFRYTDYYKRSPDEQL